MLAFLTVPMSHFNPFTFLFGFLILICVIAIVIIGVRWLLTVAGITVPPPLLYILGIIFFIILLLVLANYTGLYTW